MLRFVHHRTPAKTKLSFKAAGNATNYPTAITVKDLQAFINTAKEMGAEEDTVLGLSGNTLLDLYVEIIEQ